MKIDTIEALRNLYPTPKERAVKKQIDHLERHCRRFISLSPFTFLSSSSDSYKMDASPRGGEPGFIKVLDDKTLLIPDAPGNNRLDTLENIIATKRIGLLILIPGVDETLRINGIASLSIEESHISLCANERRRPKLVIEVKVEEVYLHCAKALMRSRLWSADAQIERSLLPTIGQMVSEQVGVDLPTETSEQMLARYAADL